MDNCGDVVERARAALEGVTEGPWIALLGVPTMNGIPTYQVKPVGRPGVVAGAMECGCPAYEPATCPVCDGHECGECYE